MDSITDLLAQLALAKKQSDLLDKEAALLRQAEDLRKKEAAIKLAEAQLLMSAHVRSFPPVVLAFDEVCVPVTSSKPKKSSKASSSKKSNKGTLRTCAHRGCKRTFYVGGDSGRHGNTKYCHDH